MRSFPSASNGKMKKLKHLNTLRVYIEILDVLGPFCTALLWRLELNCLLILAQLTQPYMKNEVLSR